MPAGVPLENALRAIATTAAYDLRSAMSDSTTPDMPMLWHYQVVGLDVLPRVRARWPDGTEGQEYLPVALTVANERLKKAYADEAEFTAPLAPDLRASVFARGGLLGPVPLLVRLQYMNECHVLNGGAVLALVRHSQRFGVRWTIGGVPVTEVGWRWGACADGASLTIINHVPETGQQRVKHQAHAHQVAVFTTADGAVHLLDLSAAQFGEEAAVRAVPELIDDALGCARSPTLAARAKSGLAPCLLCPLDSPAAARVMSTCRVVRGQRSVEDALALIDARGHARRDGYQLCGHMMPSPAFGTRDPATPGPDDDLVEGGVLAAVRKFEAALGRLREWDYRADGYA